MHKELAAGSLLPHPDRASRMSRALLKKLRHNIEQLGHYEALTVRQHPRDPDKFEVLNGHARLNVLRDLGEKRLKCDVWQVTEVQARLFLIVLNRLKGSDVPELRMSLLSELLRHQPKEELAAHVPETIGYLAKLGKLHEAVAEKEEKTPSLAPDVIVVDFYLTLAQHQVVSKALDNVAEKFGLSDSSQAIAKMAQLYLALS